MRDNTFKTSHRNMSSIFPSAPGDPRTGTDSVRPRCQVAADDQLEAALRPHAEHAAEAIAAALDELNLSYRRCDDAMVACGELQAQLSVAERTIELLRAAIRRETRKLAEVTRKLDVATAGK